MGRKVVLRLGRLAGVRGPGVFLLLPWLERTPSTIDPRVVTSSILAEQTLTRDNVPANVDTIVFWRVLDPAQAVLRVADDTAAPHGLPRSVLYGNSRRVSLIAFCPIRGPWLAVCPSECQQASSQVPVRD